MSAALAFPRPYQPESPLWQCGKLMEAPATLHGVPDALQSWWHRVDPEEFDRVSRASGRREVLRHVAFLLRSSEKVVELGCGTGLLAQEAKRRDLLGVDMCPAMIQRASEYMDQAVLDNILEFYPPQSPDAVVLCNVVEPYSSEVRRLLFSHVWEFLSPGGQVIVAVTVGKTGLGTEFESLLDLVFPTATPLQADEIEEELLAAGFEVALPELIRVQRQDVEQPQRRSFAILIGKKNSA